MNKIVTLDKELDDKFAKMKNHGFAPSQRLENPSLLSVGDALAHFLTLSPN